MKRPPPSVSFRIISALFLISWTARVSAQVAKNAAHETVGGIEVVALKTGVKDVVTIRGSLPAGDDRSPDSNPSIATLTGSMLDKGTTRHDKFAISKLLGDAGASISFSVESSSLEISARCLRQDLPLVLTLIAEELRSPLFSEEDFAKVKTHLIGSVQQELDDTDFRASDAFSRAIYPQGHGNRAAAPSEFIDGFKRATLAEVKSFYAQYYRPATMKLVVVGDADPASVLTEIKRTFADWKGGVAEPRSAKAGSVDSAREQNVFMPEKTSVSVVWGEATQLHYADPDALALRVGTSVLGSGFTGRLMSTVRDKEGLTYGIASYVSNDTFLDGDWRITASFAPENLEKGLASSKVQLTEWYRDGITDAELKRVKGDLVGSYQVSMATTEGMASLILKTLERGLPLSFIDDYGSKVNALSREQVNRAIKQHLDPEKMVVVKAGTIPGAAAAK